MLNSILYYSQQHRNTQFKNSKIINGTFGAIVINALNDININMSAVTIDDNNENETIYYYNKKIITINHNMNARTIRNAFKKKVKTII